MGFYIGAHLGNPVVDFLQRSLLKIQREKLVFQFFLAFLAIFLPVQRFSIPWIMWSDRNGSFDTHTGILYDILCHLSFVIKFHKVAFYDIFMTYRTQPPPLTTSVKKQKSQRCILDSFIQDYHYERSNRQSYSIHESSFQNCKS